MTATAWPPRQYDDSITVAPWMSAKPFPCRQNPDLFFSDSPDDVEKAKRICKTLCSRTAACLRYALEQEVREGTWGGLSEDERKPSLPGMFMCAACQQEKPVRLRRKRSWCAACALRWRKAGKPASGPPPAKSLEDRRTSSAQIEAQKKRETYARLRSAGVSKVDAAREVGLTKSTMHEYERIWVAAQADGVAA